MNKTKDRDSLFLDKERNIRKYGIEDLNEKNVLPIINRSQKNYALSEDLWSYIKDNLEFDRIDEFGKNFTNLEIIDAINNGGPKTKEIKDLINKKPKVISEEELGYVNLTLRANNWDLDNVPMPSLVLGSSLEEGDLQNVIMGKIAKSMSHFEKEGKENWDVFMDVYNKLNDMAQNFDPYYDFGDRYDFDKMLREKHGDQEIDKASPKQYKRMLNNQKLEMYLKSNVDKAVFSLIREDQMAKGMTSTQSEINKDYKQAQQLYGDDFEKIAEHVGKKHESSARKNKITINEDTMLKHGKALQMQDTIYLDTNISSDGRETSIGDLVADSSKSALENMEEQQTIKEFLDNLDKFFDTESMKISSDAANFNWMKAKEFVIDRDPSTGDMLVNSLTSGEISAMKKETYLEAKKRQALISFSSNREKIFGKDKSRGYDHDFNEDLKNVENVKELDECLNKHTKKIRALRNNIPEAKSFTTMQIEEDAKKMALAQTQAYFRFNENTKDVSFIIKEMDDLEKYLDMKIKDAKSEEDRDKAKEYNATRLNEVLEDKIDLINENRIGDNKARFPESWKRGLFQLYSLPMKKEWEKNISYQSYYKDLTAGKFKGEYDTREKQGSFFDLINEKENSKDLKVEKEKNNYEKVEDFEDYSKDKISFQEIDFLLDGSSEVEKDKSRVNSHRELSHTM